MAFGRIIRARENKSSNLHKKKDSFGNRPTTDRKNSENTRSDSPYHASNNYNNHSSSSSGQVSTSSQTSVTRKVPRPPAGHPDDNFSASLPHSSSSSQHGWYDEASAGQKAEDCLKAENNGVSLGERPPLQFPDKLNADTAARLHSAFSSLIDRMEQQGRMKFNTKPKPKDVSDSSSSSNKTPSQLQQPTSQHSHNAPTMRRRGTADSYDQGTHHSLSRSSSNLAAPPSAGNRHANRERSMRSMTYDEQQQLQQQQQQLQFPQPPPSQPSQQQSTYYDHSSGRGYDDNLDSPTDPYCASTYPPARSYYSSAVANDSRSRSSSNPHTYGADSDALLQNSEGSPNSSESSHACKTRNALGLKINTDAIAAQSRRFVRRPTIVSNGQEDENTPSLVHDEERNEPDETVPVCESPSPFDIGNSPTIRKLDDPFNTTYQEPTMMQSPPQDARNTPVAAPAPAAAAAAASANPPAYHADEILQIVQQALLQTQASTQAISVEAIQAAVMNEMICRSKANASMNSNDGARNSNGHHANGHHVPPRTPESCFSYGSGRSSPDPIMLPPPSLDNSHNWSASIRKTVQSIAEHEIREHKRNSLPYGYERDDEDDAGEYTTETREEHHHHHHHHHHHDHPQYPTRTQSKNTDINSIPWPNSRHSRRGFPMRTATNLSNTSSNHNSSTSDLVADRSLTPHAVSAAPVPTQSSFEYPEIEAYPDFDIPIGLPDHETYPDEPLPPVPSGRSRGMSNGERTTHFESALKRPGRPYNSSPFAVGANHDRVPLARRVVPMQRRLEVQE